MSHFPISFTSRAAVQTIAVGAAGAAWLVRSDAQKLQVHVLAWQEQQAAAQAIEFLLNQLRVTKSSDVQWVLAPSLLKHWLQQPPEQIESLNELHAVTIQRAQQLFGSNYPSSTNSHGSSWVVSADWHASQAFLCAAMPANWCSALMGKESMQENIVASNKENTIVSPLQLVYSRFQKQFPTHGWVAVVVAHMLYLMYFKNKKCVHIRSLQLETALKRDDLQAIALVEWQRDMLRTQLNSSQLHWLCLMPVAASNVSSTLLKPLQWHAANRADIHDAENTAYLGGQTDVRVGLSEVKLAAWCAAQCAEKQL